MAVDAKWLDGRCGCSFLSTPSAAAARRCAFGGPSRRKYLTPRMCRTTLSVRAASNKRADRSFSHRARAARGGVRRRGEPGPLSRRRNRQRRRSCTRSAPPAPPDPYLNNKRFFKALCGALTPRTALRCPLGSFRGGQATASLRRLRPLTRRWRRATSPTVCRG